MYVPGLGGVGGYSKAKSLTGPRALVESGNASFCVRRWSRHADLRSSVDCIRTEPHQYPHLVQSIRIEEKLNGDRVT